MLTTYGFSKYKFDYRNMSSEASKLVDLEINSLVTHCYGESLGIIEGNREKLEELKDKLIEDEIVDGDWVYDLIGRDRCTSIDCSVSFD